MRARSQTPQIARHRSGRSAGFAIVSYMTHEEAARALGLHNSFFQGRKLSVAWYTPAPDAIEQQQLAFFAQQLQEAELLHALRSAAPPLGGPASWGGAATAHQAAILPLPLSFDEHPVHLVDQWLNDYLNQVRPSSKWAVELCAASQK